MSRVRIFDQNSERLLLALTFITLALCAYDWYHNVILANHELQIMQFICSSVFLNNLHVYLSIVVITILPAGKNWLSSYSQKTPIKTISLLIFVISFLSHLATI